MEKVAETENLVGFGCSENEPEQKKIKIFQLYGHNFETCCFEG